MTPIVHEARQRVKETVMVAVRDVLFPTDLSPESDRAFDHARFLAERFEASLTLYHAVPVPDHRFAHWAFAHEHEIWERAEREARDALERRAETLRVSHRTVVERQVSVPRAVVDLIQAYQPDLTVLATHGREGLSHLLLGSVAEEIIEHAFRPVLCVREPDHGPALPYRRLLVPTDLSLSSGLAFPMAALVARTFGAEVVILHVTPDSTIATLSGIPDPSPPRIPTEEKVRDFCRPSFGEVPLRVRFDAGGVANRIVHAAREEEADLVVMATRGHDSLGDKLLGSNTERVVRHSPCPVLVA
jgi:nucleotide-binding universal stress UspA family protein